MADGRSLAQYLIPKSCYYIFQYLYIYENVALPLKLTMGYTANYLHSLK